MKTYDKIVIRIIQEQELIIGPLAWMEAKKVSGINILNPNEIAFNNPDEKDVINKLVTQYEKLFGEASRQVCRTAVANLIADLSPEEIPSSLK